MSGSAPSILTATVVLALGGNNIYRLSSHFRPNSTLTILPPRGLDNADLIISLGPKDFQPTDRINHGSEAIGSNDISRPTPNQVTHGGVPTFRPTIVAGRPGYVYDGGAAPQVTRSPALFATSPSPPRITAVPKAMTTTSTTTTTTTTTVPSTVKDEGYEEGEYYDDYEEEEDNVVNDGSTSSGSESPSTSSSDSENIVRTESGPVRGERVTYLNRPVYRFLGIPYASPPRRFERPQASKWWTGVFNATAFAPLCYQDIERPKTMGLHIKWATEHVSEDCLYLNIWSPSLTSETSSTQLKPVLFVIHGGTFHFGGPQLDDYEGGNIASHGDIVVVTIAYRLGPFGFFDARIPNLSGNMGVYDMQQALEWTKRNIKNFGGNPDLITLFGHNTGSIAVSIFLMSREFQPLFQRAVLASGVATSYIDSYYTVSHKSSQKLSQLAGCTSSRRGITLTTKPKIVSDCVASRPLAQLWEANAQRMEMNPFCWGISLPDKFFPYSESAEVLDQPATFGQGSKEILIGNTQYEGVMGLEYLVPGLFRQNLTGLRQGALKIAQQITDFGFSATSLETTLNFLFRRTKRPRVILEAMAEVMTDNAFICPSAYYAEKVSSYNRSVYYYLYSHKSSMSKMPPWVNATFFEEIPFFFGRPLATPSLFTPEELDFSKSMMDLLAGFVRNGKPNRIGGVEWPKYEAKSKAYVDLNARHYGQMITGRGPNEESCLTWKETLKILTRLEEAGALDSLLGVR